MAPFLSFHAPLPQLGLLQRTYFTRCHANLPGKLRYRILTVARHRSSAARAPAKHPLLKRSRIKLDPSAHDISWDACTVRGFEDGSLVFKFDQLDPREEELSLIATTATLANFAWSNAVKLGVKFPQQLEITLKKLEEYIIEFNGKTAPARTELKHSLFKTYEKAARRQEKLLINEGIEAGIEEIMLQKEVKEDHIAIVVKDEEEVSETVSVSAAAVEEVAAVAAAEEREVDTTSAPAPPSFSIYNLLKAVYLTLVLTPLRFLLSIITWVVHLPLTLYRCLPYGLRKVFHSSWPPILPATTRHISPAVADLFLDDTGFNRTSLASAGFDAQGRCAAPLTPLIDVPAWKIEQLVGCGIGDITLYRSALTHPTALPPEARALSYERLEYLGDAVLELCTRQLLMERAPDADEGVLTNQAQFLVAGSIVNKYGAWMGLDKWVLCNAYSFRDSRDGLLSSPHILGDAFEALLAAIYIDRGLEAANLFLIRVFTQCPSVEWEKIGFIRDHKGQLIKVAHQRRKPLPVYNVVSAHLRRDSASNDNSDGDSTAVRKKYWTVEVEFDGEVIGSGSNFEKREAEREAAKMALMHLGEMEGVEAQ